MADYKQRGEKPNGFAFWTNQIFGHQINGIYSPSLNVSSPHTAFDAPIDFTHVGDSGDENPLGLSAKDLFLDFITHPKVRDIALELVKDKISSIAVVQLINFIDRERFLPRVSRPRDKTTALNTLRLIVESHSPKK